MSQLQSIGSVKQKSDNSCQAIRIETNSLFTFPAHPLSNRSYENLKELN